MADELDELVAMTAADDAQAMRDLLTRNPTLKTHLESARTVYKAFVDGDQTALDAATRSQQQQQQQQQQTRPAAATFDPATLTAELDKLLAPRLSSFMASAEFNTEIDKRAEAKAKAILDSERATILGTAAKTSDEIYQVRRSHEREFGKELDTSAFTTFLDANPGKFVSLSAAHDAFVQEDRITKRVADGVQAGIAAAQTSDVPGTSLPSAQTPLGAMIRANPANKDAAERGTGIDAATKAFRQLQSAHVN